MQAPAFSLDYFPSAEVAWSLFGSQKIRVQSATPKEPRSAGPQDYLDSRVTTYGSQGSSSGPWERDLIPSGPQTPYSTGDTPPAITPYSSRSHSHRNSIVNGLSSSPEHATNKYARRSNSNLSPAFSLSKAFTSLSTSPTTQDRFKAAEADLSTSAPTAPTSSVTWGSTTFYSSTSSRSPEKRRRSQSSRRASFRTMGFDGAYDSDDEDEDEYETDELYYDASKVYTPTKKKPDERKIKVALKNQHLFDAEGHASVPLLMPQNNAKFHAYREVYADQLTAWGLHIQHAEILKFNDLINYWPTDTPVYPLQAQLVRSRVFIETEATPQTVPKYRGASMFSLSEPPPDLHNDGPMISRESVFDTEPQEAVDATTSSWDYALSKPASEKHTFEAETGTKVKPKNNSLRGSQNCYICLERIQGLFVSCPRGEHKAHATCYEEYVDGRSEQDMLGRGVSCGCKPYEAEDWTSEGLETSWGSILAMKSKKLGAV
jgi:hypothetical protein